MPGQVRVDHPINQFFITVTPKQNKSFLQPTVCILCYLEIFKLYVNYDFSWFYLLLNILKVALVLALKDAWQVMEDAGKDFWISENRDRRVQNCSTDTKRKFSFQPSEFLLWRSSSCIKPLMPSWQPRTFSWQSNSHGIYSTWEKWRFGLNTLDFTNVFLFVFRCCCSWHSALQELRALNRWS